MVESPCHNFEVPHLQGLSIINISCSSQIVERVKYYTFFGVTLHNPRKFSIVPISVIEGNF